MGDQPDRQPHQRQVVGAKRLGEYVGHEALTARMTSKRKTEPKSTAASRATAILAPPASGNTTAGVSLTNHFDRFVANRLQPEIGVAASAGKSAPAIPPASASQPATVTALPTVSASQQSAVASLPAVPTSQQSAVTILPKPLVMPPKSATTDIPKSLFLLTSDDDDSYGDSQPPYVPGVGGTAPSPLPVPDMNPPSDDDSGNNSYDGDNGDGEINDDNHPLTTWVRTT